MKKNIFNKPVVILTLILLLFTVSECLCRGYKKSGKVKYPSRLYLDFINLEEFEDSYFTWGIFADHQAEDEMNEYRPLESLDVVLLYYVLSDTDYNISEFKYYFPDLSEFFIKEKLELRIRELESEKFWIRIDNVKVDEYSEEIEGFQIYSIDDDGSKIPKIRSYVAYTDNSESANSQLVAKMYNNELGGHRLPLKKCFVDLSNVENDKVFKLFVDLRNIDKSDFMGLESVDRDKLKEYMCFSRLGDYNLVSAYVLVQPLKSLKTHEAEIQDLKKEKISIYDKVVVACGERVIYVNKNGRVLAVYPE
ncbi:MAG: hypothetical protein ABIH89_00880 [Elusimicrobiota bacterium]